ncbi:hypothetical protein JCGZ_17439 [Jatropha curcas]|uniref:Uncharacterized protein n=1 Tax=Jatropha curcas TaxID=180498 RepID=A0A067LBR9_JATCU|nr:uncharacterized protein LOC105640095 [Jatropha curcas]KDP45832.1 hypothetical protein JCGZ_17439 [Jatropha curcas]
MSGQYLSSIKMKRKELDDVSDDFSDFSLSSPARKIRRLDAELPPIMEEEEAEMHPPAVFVGGVEEKQQPMVDSGVGNQERAIVVFKPVKTNPLLHSSSNFSVSVDSDLVYGIKSQFLRSSCNGNIRLAEEEREATNECMAVVPWVPSQAAFARGIDTSQAEAPDLMEAEQVGEETMEIEFEGNNTIQSNELESGGMMSGTQGLPQWQQQHCLIPQLPQNTSTPITWFQ